MTPFASISNSDEPGNGAARWQPWQLFTPRARQAIANARQKAIELHSPAIDTEHLLWGLLQDRNATVVRVLDRGGVSVEGLRRRLEDKLRAAQHGAVMAEEKPKLTAEAQKVLEVAVETAQAMPLRETYVGTEHLLLALLDEHRDATVAQRLLLNFGAYLEVTWHGTLKELQRQRKLRD
jgi:ATP-dependent Clp protease ATP-binding subunit ClpA